MYTNIDCLFGLRSNKIAYLNWIKENKNGI